MITPRTPLSKKLHVVLVLSVILLLPSQAFAWGEKAHRIIGALAWMKLSEQAKRQVRDLLPEESSDPDGPLAAVSMWADRQSINYREQARWHFVAIPLSAATYDEKRDCADGNCIVVALNKQKVILENGGPRKERADALKYVVHLVGDVHQPLHCADNDDRGGNLVQVKFLGQISNLHKVWDFDMVEAPKMSVQQYVEELKDFKVSRGFWIDHWVNESHAIAQKYAYVIPQDRELGNTYYRRNESIMKQQLAQASERLVQILEEALTSRSKYKKSARLKVSPKSLANRQEPAGGPS
jgi:hypothetical protein